MAEIQIKTILDTSSFDAGVKTVERKIQELNNKKIKIDFSTTQTTTSRVSTTRQSTPSYRIPSYSDDDYMGSFGSFGNTGSKKASIKYALEQKVIQLVTESFKAAVTEMKAVDAELINVAKASGATNEKMKELEKGAYSLAEAYGRTASDVLEAETAFARAGYGDKIEEMAELSLLTQNAGDLTSKQANSFLLAADAAFGYEGDIQKLTAVLDGMNEVSNKNATDMSKMADGMTVAGSVFASAGESVQTFTALLGTATAATQRSGSEMARGLRTIFMNLRQIKGETEDGELIDGQSIANAAKALREFAEIETMENGELRKGSDILDELAGKWDTLSQVQKSAIAQNVAGQRQANVLVALMDNWDTYQKMQSEYATAAGSAMEENERYLDGWQAKLDKLSATWTKFVSSTLTSGLFKFFIDVANATLSFSDSLWNAALGIGGIVTMLKASKIEDILLKIKETALQLPDLFVAASGGIQSLIEAFKGGGLSLSAIVTGIGGVMTIASLIISIVKSISRSIEENKDKAFEDAKKSSQAYEKEKQSLESINSELEENQKNIDELNAKEKLTYTEQGELERLREINKELKTQQAIQQVKTDNAAKKAVQDARKALKELGITEGEQNLPEDTSDFRVNEPEAYRKLGSYIAQYNSTKQSLDDARENVLEASKKLKEAEAQDDTDEKLVKKLTKELENANEDYDDYKESLVEDESDLLEYYDKLTAQIDTINSYFDTLGNPDYSSMDNSDQLLKQQLDNAIAYKNLIEEILGITEEEQKQKTDTTITTDTEEETYEKLAEAIAKYRLQLSLLKKAQEEENTTGQITEDTFNRLLAAGVEVGTVFYDDVTGGYKLADGQLQKLTTDTRKWLDYYDGLTDVNEQIQKHRNQLNALREAQAEENITGQISAQTMQKLAEYGLDVGDVFYDEVTGGFHLAGDALSGLVDETQNWLDTYEGFGNINEQINKHKNQLGLLQKAQKEENETGSITKETFAQLTKAGVDLGEVFYDNITDGFKTSKDAIDDNIDSLQEWLETWTELDEFGNPMDAWEQGLERAQNALERFKKELQDTGERGDTLEELQKEYGAGQEFYNNQQYGSREYQGFLEMFISEDKKRELGYNFQKIGEFAYTGFVGGLMKESTTTGKMDYLAKNFEENFGGMEEAGASFVENTDGSISMLVSDMDKLVETTGISADFWYMLGDALDIYSTERIQQENQKAEISFDDIAKAAKNATGEIDVKEFVRQSTEAGKSAEDIANKLNALAHNPNVELSMDIDAKNAKETVEQIISDQEDVGKEVKTSVDASEAVTATGQFDDLSAAIARVPRAIDIKVGVSGTTSLTGDKAGRLNWSPFAEGTENAPGGLALVNEIGPEIISQNGRAFIANGGEPALVQLQPGAVVLNHIQTEKALNGAGNFGEISAYALGTKRTNRVYERDDGKGNVKLPPTAEKKGPATASNNKNSKNTGRGAAASNTTEEDEDDPWKIVEDYYNYSKDLADRAKDHLDYLVDKIQNEWDDLKEPLDDQIDALERVNDQLDRQTTLLERERDKMTKPLQDQIDAMNDAKDIQDEQLELAEKQKAVEEARAELQNAQNERTIRYFNTEKGQWEWMADKKRVQDAQDAITSAEKDLADYEYELQIKALERQVSSIEDDYQKKLDAIEEQQTANEDRIYDLEQQLQNMEDYYKAQMKPLEKQIETMERQMADYAELWAQIAITQDLPEGDLNAAINRLGNLTPEQKQSIRDIIEGVKKIPNGSGTESASSSAGEVASSIQPGKGTWESALSQIGATVDGKNMHVYGDGATVYNTITNNDSHNVSYTINGVTVQGDPSKMTISDLLESTGIYAGE